MASEALVTCEWIGFFKDAGIPSWSAFNYAVTFMENRIQKNMLADLNKEIINELGITIIGDVIAILKHAKIVHRQECSRREGVYPEPMDQSGATLSPDSSGDANLMGSKGYSKARPTHLPGTMQEALTYVTDYSLGIAEPEDITKQADLSGDLNPFWGSVENQNPYQEPSPPDENMRSGHRAAPSPFHWYRGGGRGRGPPYRGRGSGPSRVEYEEENQRYGPGGDKSNRSICRHFKVRGSCRFEMNCNFYHPGINGPPLP